MVRMLTVLMLDARLHLLALAGAAVAWGPAPGPAAPVESEFFAWRGVPGVELVAPPCRELVRHRESPGCPGCPYPETPCVAALPPPRP